VLPIQWARSSHTRESEKQAPELGLIAKALGAAQAGRGVARGPVTVARGVGKGAVCLFTLGVPRLLLVY
jgi:hypothetical protein